MRTRNIFVYFRKVIFIYLCFCASLLFNYFSLSAVVYPADEELIAKIVRYESSDTITIDKGARNKIEVGDVLVVQRSGQKIGLVRITDVSTYSSVCEIISIEPGEQIKVEDIVSYQMITGTTEANKNIVQLKNFGALPKENTDLNYDEIKLDFIYQKQINIAKENVDNGIRVRESLLQIGDILFENRFYKKAVSYYKKALEESPKNIDNPKIIYQIILCYFKLNEDEKLQVYKNFLLENYSDSIYTKMVDSIGKANMTSGVINRNSLLRRLPQEYPDFIQRGPLPLLNPNPNESEKNF